MRTSLLVVARVSIVPNQSYRRGAENVSLDSRVYIWHKENGTLIETLEGHANGCVNAVAWNPADHCMFASAGDDQAVRM